MLKFHVRSAYVKTTAFQTLSNLALWRDFSFRDCELKCSLKVGKRCRPTTRTAMLCVIAFHELTETNF